MPTPLETLVFSKTLYLRSPLAAAPGPGGHREVKNSLDHPGTCTPSSGSLGPPTQHPQRDGQGLCLSDTAQTCSYPFLLTGLGVLGPPFPAPCPDLSQGPPPAPTLL